MTSLSSQYNSEYFTVGEETAPVPQPQDFAASDTPSEAEALIRQMPCFCYLSDTVIGTLADAATLREVGPGEIVFCAGQYEAEDIYCCVGGKGVLITGMTSSGDIIRRVFSEGDTLGLEYVFAARTELARAISLEAEEKMRLVVIEADALRTVITDDHQACVGFLRELARRCLAGEAPVSEDQPSIAMRIARTLCEMAQKNDNGDWYIAAMPRHRELGAQTDASEKEAAEAVAQLISLRLMKRDYPGMIITDYPGLMAFSD